MTKTLEVLREVGHSRIAEDLSLVLAAAAQTLGKMGNQSGKLAKKGLFGQLKGFFKNDG